MRFRFTRRSVAPLSVMALMVTGTAVGVAFLQSDVDAPLSCDARVYTSLNEAHDDTRSPPSAAPVEVDSYRRALERHCEEDVASEVSRFVADGMLSDEGLERVNETWRLDEMDPTNATRGRAEAKKGGRHVMRMWDRALGLFERERFRNCEKLCRSIIDHDPSHPNALKLGLAARRARCEKANADDVSTYRRKWYDALQDVKNIGNPKREAVEFPSLDKWRMICVRGTNCRFVFDGSLDADQEVRRRLAGTTLASIDWNDKTLDETLRFLRNNSGANIIVMKAVDEVLPPEERILNLNLSNITALSALNRAVNGLEGLAYVIEDGIVKVTTVEQARKRKTVEFYEVRDLVGEVNGPAGPELNLYPSSFARVGGFNDEVDDASLQGETERLIELIRTTVDPTSWDEDPDNRIDDKSGTLVVRQTPENQHEIRRLLSDLRRSMTTTPQTDRGDSTPDAVVRPACTRADVMGEPIAVDPYRGSEPWKREQHSVAGAVTMLEDVTNGAPYDVGAILDNGGPGLPTAVLPEQTAPAPEPPTWCAGRLLDLRREPLAIAAVRVVPGDGDVRDWQQRVLLGLPDPSATISGNRFAVVVPTDSAFHLALQTHSRDWWLVENVRAGCAGLAIEVPFETMGEKAATNSANTSPESSWREYGVTFGRAPAGVGQPGQGTFAPFDDFGVPGETLLPGTDNTRGAFYGFFESGAEGDLRVRSENVYDETLGGHGLFAPEADRFGYFENPVIVDAAPISVRAPECLRTHAWDEDTGEEFYCWNLAPRLADSDRGPIADATWYLAPLGTLDRVGWRSGKLRPVRLPSDQLQVHVLDDLEVGGFRRAMEKLDCPRIEVPAPESNSRSTAAEWAWSVPVRRRSSEFSLAATLSSDRKYCDTRVRVDGKLIPVKVPVGGFLLVHGFPTNASLIGLVELK